MHLTIILEYFRGWEFPSQVPDLLIVAWIYTNSVIQTGLGLN